MSLNKTCGLSIIENDSQQSLVTIESRYHMQLNSTAILNCFYATCI